MTWICKAFTYPKEWKAEKSNLSHCGLMVAWIRVFWQINHRKAPHLTLHSSIMWLFECIHCCFKIEISWMNWIWWGCTACTLCTVFIYGGSNMKNETWKVMYRFFNFSIFLRLTHCSDPETEKEQKSNNNLKFTCIISQLTNISGANWMTSKAMFVTLGIDHTFLTWTTQPEVEWKDQSFSKDFMT